MNELELIELIKKQLAAHPSLIAGAGDDCAVIEIGLPDRFLLFKTDAVVEGIHFNAETDAEQVGHKALGRCLSDIAAMGGTPVAALVTLALPVNFEPQWVEHFYAGLNRLAERYEVAIAGGEVSTNPERKLISVSLVGTVAKSRSVLRSGARVGDAIFVTGELGGSLRGKHVDFEPRVAEGQWLAQQFDIHAMIDLSDGLASDLRHILRSSNVGAELLSEAIPISRAAKLQAKEESAAKPPLLAALSDGEDFELLFTVASRDAVPLLDAWKRQFPKLRLSCIGKITAGSALKLRDKEGSRELTLRGFVHFQKPQQ